MDNQQGERRKEHDRGSVLIITLVLVVILSVVVLAIASYSTTAVKTSPVASRRTDTNADASAALQWAIERFSSKHIRPNECDPGPVPLPLDITDGTWSNVVSNGSAVTISCEQTQDLSEEAVHLVAVATDASGVRRTVEALIEVPVYEHGARIADWRVDLEIDPNPYVTTTTVVIASTTTVGTTITTSSVPASSTTPTTAPPAPAPTCRYTVSQVDNPNGSGQGTLGRGVLTITNSGAAFTGWTVNVNPGGRTLTWDQGAVSGTYQVSSNSSNESIAGPSGATGVNAASIVAPNSAKFEVNDTFSCTMVSPP